MATETIYALFQSVSDAERAIGALGDHGIPNGQIGVVTRQGAQQIDAVDAPASFERVSDGPSEYIGEPTARYAPTLGSTAPGIIPGTEIPATSVDTADNVETVGKTGITTTTASDAGAGAGAGAGFGLVAGLLASAASLMIPGVGLVLAGGALAGAIAATAATTAAGAIAGGVAGYLSDMGMPEQAATSIEERVLEGDYLISVMVDTDQYEDIKALLLKYNAVGIDFDPIRAGGLPWQSWGSDTARRDYFDNTGRTVPVTPVPTDHIVTTDDSLDELDDADVDPVATRTVL